MPTAISLFSGAGGLDLGFKNCGFDIKWASDIDPDSVRTYAANIGSHIEQADVAELESEAIPDADILLGGFPCQGFSMANSGRREDDSRNKLYLEMLRILKGKKPSMFLAENVRGLTTMAKGQVLRRIVEDFEEAGYVVQWRLLNVADYGVPQVRHRVIIIGIRADLDWKFDYPQTTHSQYPEEGKKPWVSVAEALSRFPDPDSDHNVLNHTYSKYKLRFNGYLGHRRIDPGKPAPTVTGRGDNKGGVVVLHHPSNERRMSVRELAAVQSFPDEFEFVSNQSAAYRLIGNAVPPKFAEALAGAVLNAMASEVALAAK